jgi:hypothetical protein
VGPAPRKALGPYPRALFSRPPLHGLDAQALAAPSTPRPLPIPLRPLPPPPQDLEARHSGKALLLVSHGDTLSITLTAAAGGDLREHRANGLGTAELRRLQGAAGGGGGAAAAARPAAAAAAAR